VEAVLSAQDSVDEDLWTAALVLQHNLRLHDRDRHFQHLPQIVRV
jgi:predicted nucleic acid-binding protein